MTDTEISEDDLEAFQDELEELHEEIRAEIVRQTGVTRKELEAETPAVED
jgi:ribosome recycling factor